MKKAYLTFFLLFLTFSLHAQTITLVNSGDWGEVTNWDAQVVPDQISEDVAFNNDLSATVMNNSIYSVGNVDLFNKNILTIASGSRLNLGSSSLFDSEPSAPKNFTANNDGFLYVNGDLYIYGDLIVKNKLTLGVTGTMYVAGNIQLKNGSSLDISGKLSVDGDFTGEQNTSLTVDGTLDIGGDLSVGNKSTLTGTGKINLSGTCSDGTSDFCGIGPLPVNLLYFTATPQKTAVQLDWASSKAWDFSHYELERSADGITFNSIATIDAEENTDWVVNYSYSDRQPLSGLSYYRLKAVDIDGSFEYKGIQVVQFAGKASLKVYPNPANRGTLNVQQQEATGAKVSLKDNSGRTVYAGTMEASVKTINTSSLQPGMYVLTVESMTGVQKKHVIIQ